MSTYQRVFILFDLEEMNLITRSTADVISDGILLLAPIRMFITIRDKRLRYRLTIIFGTCIITTIVSFVHAAYLFEVKEVFLVITAMVEVNLLSTFGPHRALNLAFSERCVSYCLQYSYHGDSRYEVATTRLRCSNDTLAIPRHMVSLIQEYHPTN